MTLVNIVKSYSKYTEELKKQLLKSAHNTRRGLKNSLQKIEIDLGQIQAGEEYENEWRLETEIKEDYLETLEGNGVIKTFREETVESYGAEYIIAKISFFPQKLIDYFVDEKKSTGNVKFTHDKEWAYIKFGKTKPVKIARLATQPGRFLKLFFSTNTSKTGRTIESVFETVAKKRSSRSKKYHESIVEKNSQITVIKNVAREINRALRKANKKQKMKCCFDDYVTWIKIVEK